MIQDQYADAIEAAVEDRDRLEALADEVEKAAALDEERRTYLLGNIDRYLADFELEDEAASIDEFDDDLLARAER